jgi:hypothetical protein
MLLSRRSWPAPVHMTPLGRTGQPRWLNVTQLCPMRENWRKKSACGVSEMLLKKSAFAARADWAVYGLFPNLRDSGPFRGDGKGRLPVRVAGKRPLTIAVSRRGTLNQPGGCNPVQFANDRDRCDRECRPDSRRLRKRDNPLTGRPENPFTACQGEFGAATCCC